MYDFVFGKKDVFWNQHRHYCLTSCFKPIPYSCILIPFKTPISCILCWPHRGLFYILLNLEVLLLFFVFILLLNSFPKTSNKNSGCNCNSKNYFQINTKISWLKKLKKKKKKFFRQQNWKSNKNKEFLLICCSVILWSQFIKGSENSDCIKILCR